MKLCLISRIPSVHPVTKRDCDILTKMGYEVITQNGKFVAAVRRSR